MRQLLRFINKAMKMLIFFFILTLLCCSLTFAQANESSCPGIVISPFDESAEVNKTGTFTAKIGKEFENKNVTYKWTLKGAEILSGQNTKTITYRRTEYELLVSVQVWGLPPQCKNTANVISVIERSRQVFDGYDKISLSEEKAKIDKFFIELKKEPSIGVIQLEDNRGVRRRLQFLDSYMTSKGYDKSRVAYLIGIDKEQPGVSKVLWIIPLGVLMPGCKDCKLIWAAGFAKDKKLINNK